MGWIKRIFGISDTPLPQDEGSWTWSENGEVMVDLDRTLELARPGSAVRLEGRELPERILVVNDEDGNYHAYGNRCTHFGRRIDLLKDGGGLMCCSVNKSRFNFEGEVVNGPAKGPIRILPVEATSGTLKIKVN